jgi:hypothetical protein
MRTTLDIDDDVLRAAKERARAEGTTAGKVLSELARRALTAKRVDIATSPTEVDPVLGFAPLPTRGVIVTDQDVEKIREAEGL